MAQKHLENVLEASGLPADQVKALVELPDDTAEFKADTYSGAIRTNVETAVKNDPKFYETLNKESIPKEFLKTLEAEQYGRSAAQVRANMLKAVGLAEKDFADLGEDGKKIDVFTPAFVKKLSEGKVGSKELQEKLIEANNKIQEMETEKPTLEKKYQDQYAEKLNDYTLNANVLAHLSSVQNLKAPAKYLRADLVNQLKGKYAFHIDGETVEIRQKDKPDLKVLVDNGTKALTLAQAIDTILEADQLVEKKNTTTTTTKTVNVNTGGGGLKISGNVNDKIAKRLAEDEKAGGAK